MRTLFVLFLLFCQMVDVTVVSLSSSSASKVQQRIAVFGGSGTVGQEVCRVLVESCGYDKENLVSVSKSGAKKVSSESSWTKNIDWISADLNETAKKADLIETIGKFDVCIDCVGTKPTDVKFSYNQWERELRTADEPLTETIAAIAKEAGAARFVYLSVSSDFNEAYGGALEGFVDSKLAAEQALQAIYNNNEDDDNASNDVISIVAPTTTCGQDDNGKPQDFMVMNPLVQVLGGGVLALSKISYEDWVLRCRLMKPVTLQKVARVAVAAGFGLTRGKKRPSTAEELGFDEVPRYAQMSRNYFEEGNDKNVDFVDGNEGCEILAEAVATPEMLRAAAAATTDAIPQQTTS